MATTSTWSVRDVAIEVASMYAVAALKDPEEVAKKLLEEAQEDIVAARETLETKLLEHLDRVIND